MSASAAGSACPSAGLSTGLSPCLSVSIVLSSTARVLRLWHPSLSSGSSRMRAASSSRSRLSRRNSRASSSVISRSISSRLLLWSDSLLLPLSLLISSSGRIERVPAHEQIKVLFCFAYL
ncbi:MAG: hypothetical protein ACK55I_04070, partial [bacterium]